MSHRPDGSIPAKDICSLDTARARPTRMVRNAPQSIASARLSRKRPASIAKSPLQEDSWTRRAEMAHDLRPEAARFSFYFSFSFALFMISLIHILQLSPKCFNDVHDLLFSSPHSSCVLNFERRGRWRMRQIGFAIKKKIKIKKKIGGKVHGNYRHVTASINKRLRTKRQT